MHRLCIVLESKPEGLKVRLQVKENLPTEADGPLHDLKPGDWVVIKDLRR
ncbi:hypothetical protein P4O66_017900, partial [Electrophorus voltai]